MNCRDLSSWDGCQTLGWVPFCHPGPSYTNTSLTASCSDWVGCGGTSPWLMQIHKHVMEVIYSSVAWPCLFKFFLSKCWSAWVQWLYETTIHLLHKSPDYTVSLSTSHASHSLLSGPPMTHRRGHTKGTSKGAYGRYGVCAVCSEGTLKNLRVSEE